MDFLTKFDGTNRQPRDVQREALAWIQENWSRNVLALSLPTGVGKSAIARAIQLATGADVIPPTNQLMDQYTGLYEGVNALKGKQKYECHNTKLSCGDAYEITKDMSPDDKGNPCTGYCTDCPYNRARTLASLNPTFFNPYSLFYFNLTKGTKENVLVIDEAHKLIDVLMGMAGKSFHGKRYDIPRSLADIKIDEWLKKQIVRLQDEKERETEPKRIAYLADEIENIRNTHDGYVAAPETYAIAIESNKDRSKSLVVKPTLPPRKLSDKLLSCSKLILLSATILPSDVEEILGHDDFAFLSLPSPIDKSRRQIIYAPAPFPMNSKTSARDIASEINRLVARHSGQNILIHLTYGIADRVTEYLNFPFLRNTPENKDEIVARFKSEGGVFVASGCNEGIDLPGDECRINIIPMLFRLNPTDPVVRKKLERPGGRKWYNAETLKATIQQAGRSTRGLDDYSTTYILDPAFARLISDPSLPVPSYFQEAIRWQM